MNKLISIIIVNHNGLNLLKKCLKSVYGQSYKNIEVILVDNASTDRSVDYVMSTYPNTKIIKSRENLGFAEANNEGYRKSTGDYILFLNNDTEVSNNFLEILLKGFRSKIVGGLQSKIMLMDQRGVHDCAGSYLTYTGYLFHYAYKQKDKSEFDKVRDIYSAKGASMIFRRDVLEKVKVDGEIFDSRYFAYFEETDLCHRVWLAGYKILYYPESIIFHKMGATSSAFNQSFIQFHSFKNRINTYLKNFEFKSLIYILPIHLFISYVGAIIYLLQLKADLFVAINKAILWNMKEIGNTLKKRNIIKKHMKNISDKKLFKIIMKNPNISYYYYLFTGLEKYKYRELT